MTDVQWYKKSGIGLHATKEMDYTIVTTGPESGWVDVKVLEDTPTSADQPSKFVYTDPKKGDLYFQVGTSGLYDASTNGRIRVPMRREFPIKLTHGNYNVDSLQTELQLKFDNATDRIQIPTFNLNDGPSEDLSISEYTHLKGDLVALHDSKTTEEQYSSPYRDLKTESDYVFLQPSHGGYFHGYYDVTTVVDLVSVAVETEPQPNGVLKSTGNGILDSGLSGGILSFDTTSLPVSGSSGSSGDFFVNGNVYIAHQSSGTGCTVSFTIPSAGGNITEVNIISAGEGYTLSEDVLFVSSSVASTQSFFYLPVSALKSSVAASTGDLILLGSQATPSQNGVYKVLDPGSTSKQWIISKTSIPTSAFIFDETSTELYRRNGDTYTKESSTPAPTKFYGVRMTGQSLDYDGSYKIQEASDSTATGMTFGFGKAKLQVEYDDHQNRFVFRRGDSGGLFQTGGFQISSGSNRLAIVLGLPHLVTQQQLTTSDFYSAGVLIESINKYKPSGISEIIDNPEELKYRLHYAVSYNCVNVHAEDTVYIRAQNLRVNGVETFDGNQQNLLAKVPLSVGGNGIEFHEPLAPFICDLGNGSGSGVDRLRILLTDGQRQEIDFQGVNHSMTILFTIYKKGDEGGSTMDNTNNESRRPNLVKPDFNRYRAS